MSVKLLASCKLKMHAAEQIRTLWDGGCTGALGWGRRASSAPRARGAGGLRGQGTKARRAKLGRAQDPQPTLGGASVGDQRPKAAARLQGARALTALTAPGSCKRSSGSISGWGQFLRSPALPSPGFQASPTRPRPQAPTALTASRAQGPGRTGAHLAAMPCLWPFWSRMPAAYF